MVQTAPTAYGFYDNDNSSGSTTFGGGDGVSTRQVADEKAPQADVTKLRRQYLDYLQTKQPEIEEQKIARRYYHGAQWSAEAVKALRDRRQPIITYNRIAPKINGIVGLVERLRQDPKAYPRNPRNQNGASVATQSIRAVLDGVQWQMISAEVCRLGATEGYGGIGLELTRGDHQDPDVSLDVVHNEDFFYDPRSRNFDFSDCRYMGIGKWIDEAECIEMFPEFEDLITSIINTGTDMTTNADNEYKWILVTDRRLRLVEHWYIQDGQWYWCFYVGEVYIDSGISPFINETGKTISRFIMFSASVDHDADRHGFVRDMQGAQDEINQRRSKALHISNSRRLILEKGAVNDVETARREWARPDGVLEVNPNKSAKPDDTQADLAAQLQFLIEAKQEIERIANVTPTVGQGDAPRNLSGRAINLLQQGATAELGPFVLAYRDWKLRVYRAVWFAITRFWQAERWIRVNDDQGLAQFIQVNGVDVDQRGIPVVVNAVGQIDVDIILDEGPDVINMMSDSFDILLGMAQAGLQIPLDVFIELAPLQSSVKQSLAQKMQAAQNQPPNPMQQLQMAGQAAEVENLKAHTAQRKAQTFKDLAGAQKATADAAKANQQAHGTAHDTLRQNIQLMQELMSPNQGPPGGQGGPPGQPQPMTAPPRPAPQPAPAPAPQALAGPPGGTAPAPPLPGAMLAPDGQHYVPHPLKPGKFMRVVRGRR